jgi:hypothetical protein
MPCPALGSVQAQVYAQVQVQVVVLVVLVWVFRGTEYRPACTYIDHVVVGRQSPVLNESTYLGMCLARSRSLSVSDPVCLSVCLSVSLAVWLAGWLDVFITGETRGRDHQSLPIQQPPPSLPEQCSQSGPFGHCFNM